MSERIVGIDLGTTNSAVAVFEEGGARVLPNQLGDLLTPSAVARDREGQLVIGRTAKDILAVYPERGAAFFKRSMGRDERFKLGGEELTPIELSSMVLGSIRADAERALGEPVLRCVISVPAYFDEAQRVATQKAGSLAGLEVVRIVNEPTAAAIAYGLHEQDEKTFLMFDLGGGTLDVCVMELFEGVLEVKSTAGLSRLGGEDFTASLRSRALREVGLMAEYAEMADPEAMALLYARCELAKRKLSTDEGVEIAIPPVKGMAEQEQRVELSAKQVEDAWEPLLRQLVSPVRSALRGAKLGPEEIEQVILVGGATRMPPVRRMVQELLRREPLSHVDPDLAVVRGTAVQAALCADDDAVGDLVVTDVASHSLGVAVVKNLAGVHVEGHFAPIIHRNTVLPTSRTDDFHTVHPGQTEIELEVYEGESRRVSENRLLGTLRIKGIPTGPAGQAVKVTFTFDLNGVLEVEALVGGEGGKTYNALFERTGRSLSPKELELAKARIGEIRADPTQKPELRDLLARADLLIRDLTGDERQVLEHMINALEAAIITRTPKLIEESAEQLRQAVDALGGEERW